MTLPSPRSVLAPNSTPLPLDDTLQSPRNQKADGRRPETDASHDEERDGIPWQQKCDGNRAGEYRGDSEPDRNINALHVPARAIALGRFACIGAPMLSCSLTWQPPPPT